MDIHKDRNPAGINAESLAKGKIAIARRFPHLSFKEVEVACFLLQGAQSKSIAAFLSIEPVTVENHRVRIRKKLGLKRGQDLCVYLMSEAG